MKTFFTKTLLTISLITSILGVSGAQVASQPLPPLQAPNPIAFIDVSNAQGSSGVFRCDNSVGYVLRSTTPSNDVRAVISQKYTYHFFDQLRENSGQMVNSSNKRFDVNLSGGINSTDIGIVRGALVEPRDQVYSDRFVQEVRENLAKPVDDNNRRYDIDNNNIIAGTDVVFAQIRTVENLLNNTGSLKTYEGTFAADNTSTYTLECMGVNSADEKSYTPPTRLPPVVEVLPTLNPITTTTFCPVLDTNGDGLIQAFVDGITLQRSLNPFLPESSITNNVSLSSNSTRSTGQSIRAFVNANISSYDLDGDGKSLSSSDALLITRYLLGISRDSIFNDITGIDQKNIKLKADIINSLNGICSKSAQTPSENPPVTVCTKEYNPVCGQPPMPTCPAGMSCIQVMPQPKTYSNECVMRSEGATLISSGECPTRLPPELPQCPSGTFTNNNCKCPKGTVMKGVNSVGFSFKYTCEPEKEPTPIVTPPKACPTGVFSDPNCICPNGKGPEGVPSIGFNSMYRCSTSVTATSTNISKIKLLSPVNRVSLKEGDTVEIKWTSENLTINDQIYVGVFNGPSADLQYPNIQLSLLPPSQSSYTWKVTKNSNWGIGAVPFVKRIAEFLGIKTASAVEVSTDYTILVSVRRYDKEVAFDSTSFKIVDSNSSVCTTVYKPVCGQPPMPTCPAGMSCIQVMPQPKTYSNECVMRAAGASILYEGVCKEDGSTVVGDVDDEATPNECINLTYNMRLRSRDSATNGEVSDLQFFLTSRGYMSGEPTGYFGAVTQEAVRKFQSETGLISSGIVGQFTRAKIREVSCPSGTSAVSVMDVRSDNANVPDSQIFKPLPTATTASAQSISNVISKLEVVANQKELSVINSENDLTTLRIKLKAGDIVDPKVNYFVYAKYKGEDRFCILTKDFNLVAKRDYNLDRNTKSSCINGGELGAINSIEKVFVNKR